MGKRKEITLDQAHIFSLKKWNYIVGNREDRRLMVEKHPELSGLLFLCGYCHYFIEQENGGCAACPLMYFTNEARLGGNYACSVEGHPYYEWRNCWDETKPEKARAVLNMVEVANAMHWDGKEIIKRKK